MESTKNGNQTLLDEANASKATRLYKPPILTKLFKGPYKFSNSGWIWWIKGSDVLTSLMKLERFLSKKRTKYIKILKGPGIPEHPMRRYYYKITNTKMPSHDFFVKHSVNIPFIKRIGALLNVRNFLTGRNHLTAECINTEILFTYLHENVVPVAAFGEYIKFELPKEQILIQLFLSDYKTLYQYWDSNISFNERVKLIVKLINLLKLLHKFGICHRDLQLKNIFVPDNMEKPLKIIDCAALTFSSVRSLSTAVNLSKVLYELNGRRPTLAEGLEEISLNLLNYIIENEPYSAEANRILLLLLRYDFKVKRATKRLKLLQGKIKFDRLEHMLKSESAKISKNQNWEVYGKQHEKELVDALNVAIKLHQKINR